MIPILVDSCIYISYLKRKIDVRQLLVPALRSGRLYNCGVVRAEVLRGIREEKFYSEVEEFFDIIPEVPADAKIWRQVSRLAWQAARNGLAPPTTDFVIAACAMRVRATVITLDKHFNQIPGVTVSAELPL
ncbi:MAG: PilT protein domain protein [Verrucomicrobiaceae bacterium]|nr:PilT protein domain protein [Verrucomicrobiaceae bacterium]